MMAVTISSCSKDDEPSNSKNPVKDPENTVTVNLLAGQSSNKAVILGSYVTVYVDDAYNLATGTYTSIIDVGPVAGLGNITSVPESGWKYETAAIVGHGYVLKGNYTYGGGDVARLYIEKEMVSSSGAIMGYTVKYQCPMDM